MLRCLTLFLLCLPFSLLSQEQFGKSKAEVKKDLEAKAVAGRQSVKTTDSTVVLSVTEKYGLVKFIYRFDKATGKCNYQKILATCDSCYKSYLDNYLADKSYGWKKLNENQYVSNFESQLLIELPVDEKEYSFILFKSNWSKELYDILLKN